MGTFRHPMYDHLDDGLHTTVFAWWLAERGAREMPGVERLDFGDIAELAPHLGTARVQANGRGFTHGHVPLSCAAFYDPDLFSQSDAPHLRHLHAVCGETRRLRSPVYSETVLWLEVSGHVWVMCLVLPLCGPGGRVDMLLYSMRLIPRLRGQTWDALRHGAVEEALEVKRVSYQKFMVGWNEEVFLFRWMEPDIEDWTAYGHADTETVMNRSSLRASRRTGILRRGRRGVRGPPWGMLRRQRRS